MNGHQFLKLVEEHGGLARIHVRPMDCPRTGRRGWANTYVCHDGWRYTPSRQLEAAALEVMQRREQIGRVHPRTSVEESFEGEPE